MQRHRERHGAFLGQAIHAGHHARGRDRDAPARQAVAVVVDHQACRRDHRIQVEHRLAHAHEDDVADRARTAAHGAVLVRAQRLVREPELADDFSGAQVAVEALLARRTERAIERAAGLAGHAQRAAPVFGNEHRLDRIRAVHLEQPFARAVGRRAVPDHHRRFDRGGGAELAAQVLGDIAHRGEIGRAAAMDPLQDLARAERLLAESGEDPFHALRVEAEEVGGHGRCHFPTWERPRSRGRRTRSRCARSPARPNRAPRWRRSNRRSRRGWSPSPPSSDRWRPSARGS